MGLLLLSTWQLPGPRPAGAGGCALLATARSQSGRRKPGGERQQREPLAAAWAAAAPELWEAVGRMAAVPEWAPAAAGHRQTLRALGAAAGWPAGGRRPSAARAATLVAELGQLGEFLSHIKLYRAATAAHRLAWAMLQLGQEAGGAAAAGPAELISGAAALASALYADFQFAEALELLGQVQQLAARLPAAAQAVLARLESTVHECRGDFVSALYHFETAVRLKPPGQEAADLQSLALHVDLLKRVSLTAGSDMPAEVKQSMDMQLATKVEQLLAAGQWQLSTQLPSRYVPGLRAQPWHAAAEWADTAPQIGRAIEYLQRPDTWQPLLAEFARLSAAGFVAPERECIHVAAVDGAVGGGDGSPPTAAWRRFELTGYWHAPLDGGGCAAGLAPAGCAVLEAVRNQLIGLRVLRAGFSAIAAGGRLKPHHGMTNGQLKLHLGLKVPRTPAADCASFRVGNVTRTPAWCVTLAAHPALGYEY